MFRKSLGNNLIIAVLAVAAAVWAVPEVRAAVVLSESEVSADAAVGQGLAALVQIDPVAIAREDSLGGMTGLPLVPTDEERERDAQKDRPLKILHGSLMNAPADMSPSSNSLSQLTGSGRRRLRRAERSGFASAERSLHSSSTRALPDSANWTSTPPVAPCVGARKTCMPFSQALRKTLGVETK